MNIFATADSVPSIAMDYGRVIFAASLLVISNLAQCLEAHKPGKDRRIVGGEPADIKDFPYQVQILYPNIPRCGGSIIHPKYILTAAHCTNRSRPSDLRIRTNSSTISGGTIRQVSKIIQHPKYFANFSYPRHYDYDFAILELSEILEFGLGTKPLKLPSQDENVPDGTMAVVTGWGVLQENGWLSSDLRKVSVPIVDQETCKEAYGLRLSSRMMCAGYREGGKDACQGDSGGPLVVNGTLIGITSWGIGCARPNYPGVYARVSYFIDFLRSNIPE